MQEVKLNKLRLESACKGDDAQALISLLPEGIDPNTRLGFEHKTPLHVACAKGWARAVEALTAGGANTEALDLQGQTPLMKAAREGHFDCMRALLKHGADIRTRGPDGVTVLHCPALDKHPDMIQELIKTGADPLAKTNSGGVAGGSLKDAACMSIMLQHGVDPFVPSIYGSPFWVWAAQSETKETVRMILTEYPKESVREHVDTRAPYHNATALAYAAFRGDAEMVQLLAEHGADVNLPGSRHGTPFYNALKQGHVHVLGVLRKFGAKPCMMALPDGRDRAAWFWECGLLHSMPSAAANGAWLPVSSPDGGSLSVDAGSEVEGTGRMDPGGAGWRVSMQTTSGAWVPV